MLTKVYHGDHLYLRRVTEVGQMNFFVILKRDDGGEPQSLHRDCGLDLNVLADLDLITPALDGTILPGVTRDSILSLARTHGSDPHSPSSLSTSKTLIPKLHAHERAFNMAQFISWLEDGTLLEAFGSGTASIICPVSRIGYEGRDLVLPTYEGGAGPVSKALWERIVEIQEGRRESQWSVLCE